MGSELSVSGSSRLPRSDFLLALLCDTPAKGGHMAFDFILRNARIADGTAFKSVDIAVANGRIAAIGTRLPGEGENVDAGGRFVSPGLVESHFHLDKARILDRCAP